MNRTILGSSLLLLLAASAAWPRTYVCPSQPPLPDLLRASEAVFFGTLLDWYSRDETSSVATFVVSRSWKGRERFVPLVFGEEVGGPPSEYREGEPYFVFAYTGPSGELTTDVCKTASLDNLYKSERDLKAALGEPLWEMAVDPGEIAALREERRRERIGAMVCPAPSPAPRVLRLTVSPDVPAGRILEKDEVADESGRTLFWYEISRFPAQDRTHRLMIANKNRCGLRIEARLAAAKPGEETHADLSPHAMEHLGLLLPEGEVELELSWSFEPAE